jgi:glycosyltransferase involved in cell wall biosynthesis
MMDENLKYVLITCAKNEEKNLPGLIESVVKQTEIPALWVILDDSSNDHSPNILDEAGNKYPWILIKTIANQNEYDLENNYAYKCNIGFQSAFAYCQAQGIKYGYIALSDADMIYPENYFAYMIEYLSKHTNYGVVSGKLYIKKNGRSYRENKDVLDVSYPYGTGRVWCRDAFEATGGYLLTKSPDAVSNILAILNHWRVTQLDLIYYQTRETGEGVNVWAGYYSRGRSARYLNYNILSVINMCLSIVFISRQKKSVIKSLAYLYGYFKSIIYREPQIDNNAVRDYFGSYKITFQHYCSFIKKLIRG